MRTSSSCTNFGAGAPGVGAGGAPGAVIAAILAGRAARDWEGRERGRRGAGFDSRRLHSQPRGDAGVFFHVYQGRRERDSAPPGNPAKSLLVTLVHWYARRPRPFAAVCV